MDSVSLYSWFLFSISLGGELLFEKRCEKNIWNPDPNNLTQSKNLILNMIFDTISIPYNNMWTSRFQYLYIKVYFQVIAIYVHRNETSK